MGTSIPDLPCSFGRYRLLERVGGGGMASVYRATLSVEGGFEKEVAVKLVRDELASDPQFTRMFLDEARLSARLSHANLVQTFDFGQVDETYFIAMEFVRGRTLSDLLRVCRTKAIPFGLPRSLHLAVEVAKGLGYAHRLNDVDGAPLGLVHRDVSPQNVLVSREGEVKLADFGIAKAALRSHVTQPGRVRGKCAYMAPEQARGAEVDARADIFALGIVLWECVTGAALFDGPSDAAILLQVIEKAIAPPSRLVPGIPPELDNLVLRMLARDPEARPASGALVSRELADLLLGLVRSQAEYDLGELQRALGSETLVYRAVSPAERPAPLRPALTKSDAAAETATSPDPAPLVPRDTSGAPDSIPKTAPRTRAAVTPGADAAKEASEVGPLREPATTAEARPVRGPRASSLEAQGGRPTSTRTIENRALIPREKQRTRLIALGVLALAVALGGVVYGRGLEGTDPEPQLPRAQTAKDAAATEGASAPSNVVVGDGATSSVGQAGAGSGGTTGSGTASFTAVVGGAAEDAPTEVDAAASRALAPRAEADTREKATASLGRSSRGFREDVRAAPRPPSHAKKLEPVTRAHRRAAAPTSAGPVAATIDETATRLVLSTKLVGHVEVVVDGSRLVSLRPNVPRPIAIEAGRHEVRFLQRPLDSTAGRSSACAVAIVASAGSQHALLFDASGSVVELRGGKSRKLSCLPEPTHR